MDQNENMNVNDFPEVERVPEGKIIMFVDSEDNTGGTISFEKMKKQIAEDTTDQTARKKIEDLKSQMKSDKSLTEDGGFADARVVGNKFVEVAVNAGNLEKQVDELAGNISEIVKPSDIEKAVDEYLKENTEKLLPENIVFVEDSDDEVLTEDDIIEKVMDKLELKMVNEQVLGLYMGSKILTSISLENITVSEIPCTSITLKPSSIVVYGKVTLEILGTTTPPDCTQKIRWFTNNPDLATVIGGTVQTTGKKGKVIITAYCGNREATCEVEIAAYVFPPVNFQIGEISEAVGSSYARTPDAKKMRISTDYMKTPVDTTITVTAGNDYLYQLYKYKNDKLDSYTSWLGCAGTIEIMSSEFSGFALKIRKYSYGEWNDEDIAAFTKTVTIEGM